MAETATYTCAHAGCGKPFTARTYERSQGRALFCSKSCKAREQDAMDVRDARGQGSEHEAGVGALEAGWFGCRRGF